MGKIKEGLRLKIQFSPDEVQDLYLLAGTDNPQLQAAIIKASLFGTKASFDPASIKRQIQLVQRMSEFGLRGDLSVSHEDARALECGNDTLELPCVKDAVCRWAVANEEAMRWMRSRMTTIHTYHYLWIVLQATATELLEALQADIVSELQAEQDRLIASGVLTLTGIPDSAESDPSTHLMD